MKKSNLAFGKKNYRLLLIGLGVLVLGFVLMSLDKEEFGFGVLGLWVGPLTILAGFGIQFAAILTHDEVPELENQPARAGASAGKAKDTARNNSNVKTGNVKRKPAQVSKKRKRKSNR